MGTDSEKQRADESIKLLNYGFRFFETHKLYNAVDQLKQAKVWKGEIDQIAVGLQQDLYITIPRNQYKNLDASVHLNSQLTAPIRKGEQIGEITVTLESNEIAIKPLIALRDVNEGGFFSRMLDNVMMKFE